MFDQQIIKTSNFTLSVFDVSSVLRCGMIFLLLALVGACANNSISSMTPDEMWAKGKENSVKGEKIIAAQQAKLDKARAQVREGEAMIERGTEAVENGRREYQASVTKFGAANKPDQVEFESERLKNIAKGWKKGVEDIKNGNKLISEGNKSIQKAQKKVMEGRLLMDEGSQLMIQSQTSTY